MRPAAAAIAKPMRNGHRLRDICSTSVSMRGCVVIVVTVIVGDWLEPVPVVVAAPAVGADDAVTLFVATVSAASKRSEAGTPTPATASRGFDVLTFGGLRR
jgi:hypothetical protein